jgi:hypothetical protein
MDVQRRRDRGRPQPVWLLALMGWLAADAVAASLFRGGIEVAESPLPEISRMSPRQLRRLPGIGEGRAVAIARARWEQGWKPGPLLLSDVPGVGPHTQEQVRSWLEAAGSATTGVSQTSDSHEPADAGSDLARGSVHSPLRATSQDLEADLPPSEPARREIPESIGSGSSPPAPCPSAGP